MTGLERIRAAFSGQKSDRLPWVPFAGVHAGFLKGYTAREVLTDASKLVESLLEVNRLYKPDGQPVLFDLQLEAEALGCDLLWSDDTPPSVSSHPLSESTIIPDAIPKADAGRLPFALTAMSAMKKAVGETTALYGLVCGPFTLASHLRGTQLFLDMVMEPEYVDALLGWTNRVVQAVSGYYVDAGMDVVAVVDPLVSQISPDHFRRYLEQPFSTIFADIRSRGALSSFFVCGNATNTIEPMCRTRPDNISVDENVALPAAKQTTDRYGISIGGNIPLTSVMLFGSQQDNMKYVVEMLDAVSHDRLVVSPGCDMPYSVPPENVIAVEQAVHETEQVREMVRTYEGRTFQFTGTLPVYAALKRPLVEVFTLNSATCAACTYMWKAALDAKETFGEAIDVVEYPYTSTENIGRCAAMGVTKLPSLYIDGVLAYSSLIPNRKELHASIMQALKQRKP